MAVTVSVEKGWGLHPGMGTRISEEVTTSGPGGIAISGPRFFSVTDGAPCSADRLQMQHAVTAQPGEECSKNPMLAHLPSQRAPGDTAVTSCKKRHNRALVVVMVVTVVCSVQGTGRDRRDSTAAGQGGGGAGECSKPRRCEEVRGTGKWA